MPPSKHSKHRLRVRLGWVRARGSWVSSPPPRSLLARQPRAEAPRAARSSAGPPRPSAAERRRSLRASAPPARTSGPVASEIRKPTQNVAGVYTCIIYIYICTLFMNSCLTCGAGIGEPTCFPIWRSKVQSAPNGPPFGGCSGSCLFLFLRGEPSLSGKALLNPREAQQNTRTANQTKGGSGDQMGYGTAHCDVGIQTAEVPKQKTKRTHEKSRAP